MQKGTTPSWMRPFRVLKEIPEGFVDVNIIDLLAETGMAQSKGEARRLIEQNIIWIDNGLSNGDLHSWLKSETTIFDRLQKAALHEKKFLLVEIDDVICVGKTIDDAVCHRIVFVAQSKEM